jgi:hypothetical protein
MKRFLSDERNGKIIRIAEEESDRITSSPVFGIYFAQHFVV